MYRPRIGPLGLAATAGCAALLAMALPASAHVTVNPGTATQGSETELAFRVPTEVDNASTVKVQVFFPTSQPIGSVAVKPHPGWSFKLTDVKLAKPIQTDDGAVSQAVSEITWTAESAATAIKPGEYDDFAVSAGPLPSAKSMVFKVLQTYSDRQVVRWIDLASPGAPEPEHPAPVLTLTPAGSTGTDGAATMAMPPPSDPAVAKQAAHADSESKTALWLAGIALVVGLAAGAAGGLALRKRPGTRPQAG